jgi:hypothetical protein
MNQTELFQGMKFKWLRKQTNKQTKKTNQTKPHEEILNIPSHKGNTNQHHVKVPPQFC